MFASLVLVATLAASPPPLEATAHVGAPQVLYTSPFFRTLGVADGLPSSGVQKIVQDRDGYIWIGTSDGLARYDGVGFKIYRHDSSDPKSISGNDVATVFVDRDNRIWCGGANTGLNMLDAKRTGFVHFEHDDKNPRSLGGADVWSISQSSDGAIWAGHSSNGLSRLNSTDATFTRFAHEDANPDSPSSNRIFMVRGDSQGRLWIGSSKGLDLYGVDHHFRHVDFSDVPGEKGINAFELVERDDGSVWVAMRRGVVRVAADLKASVVASSNLTDSRATTLAYDRLGYLWIGTLRGLNRMGPDGRLQKFLEGTIPGALPNAQVFDVLRDQQDGMWFATTEGGIARLPPNWENFSLYRNAPDDPNSLSDDRVHGLGLDRDGAIWAVSGEGSIDRLDTSTGQVERFAKRWQVPDKLLESILPGSDGQIWVGYTKGIRIYDRNSGQFSDLAASSDQENTLLLGQIDSLLEDASGAIWAKSWGKGINRIDPKTHMIERFDTEHSGLRGTGQIGFDPAGLPLVASSNGLDRFDTQSRKFLPVPGGPAQYVLEFAFGKDGSLWLQVLGALQHYRYEHGQMSLIESVGEAQGWPTLTSAGMQVDDRGVVWVTSANGLWRYDPIARTIRVFDTHDGLASAEFSRQFLLKRPDGSLFGATKLGIVGFQPARLAESGQPPPLLFDTAIVRRDGRDVSLDVDSSRVIALRWNDRDLRLSARALAYANPAANRYQWQLGGVDTNWIDTGSRGEREYSQLPSGRHRLKVRAANTNGVWKELAPITFEQAAPPWATRTALALYAISLLAIAWLALRGYRARIERGHAFELAEQQRSLAQSASEAKTHFLATMGHEIRTPMTGVLGMTELLLRTPLDAKQRAFAQAIQTSGNMMLRLVNDSLDLARIEAGKLELEDAAVDLHVLMAELAALAQTLAEAKGLSFACTIATDAPRLVRGDAVRIKQIFLNLVNNAIKFTERGGVAIDLARTDEGAAQFSVQDSGPGIADSTRARLFRRFEQEHGARQRHGGSGLGLAICRELVARMGGEIDLQSVVGKGSRFVVALPLSELADTDTSAQTTAASALPIEAAAIEGVAEPDGMRILLVEDDPTVAAVLLGLLETRGHRVRHVAQGLAALGELDAGAFDAALLDLDLPGIDGLALARMLRAREVRDDLKRLPLIGISARSVGNEETLCLAAGMDAFLRKPILGRVLDQTLRRARVEIG